MFLFDGRIDVFHDVCLNGIGGVIWKGRKPLGCGQDEILVAHDHDGGRATLRASRQRESRDLGRVRRINYRTL